MGDLLGLGFAAAGLLALVILAHGSLRRDWRWTAVLVVVVATLSTPGLPLAGVAIPLGPLNVHPLDMVAVLTLLVAVSRFERTQASWGIVLGFVLLAGLSWARGLTAHGFQTATNGSRAVLLIVAVTAFAAGTAGRDAFPFLRAIWLWAGVALSALALLRTALGPVEALVGLRVLTSAPALIVAQSAVLAVTHMDPRWRRMAPVLLAVVLLSRQTTVWVATAVMLLIVVLAHAAGRGDRTGGVLRTGPLLLFGASASIGVLLGSESIRQGLLDAAQKLTFASGTGAWRLRGWVSLLDQYGDSGVIDQLFGLPAGTVLARRIGEGELGGLVTVSAHNMYVQMLMALGVVGLLLVVLLILRAAWGSRHVDDPGSAVALVAGIAVFGIGYSFPPAQFLWLGALAAVAIPTGREPQERVAAPDAAVAARNSGGALAVNLS